MNPENPDVTFPLIVERWKSHEEIRREYLDSLSPEELRQVDSSHYWYKYGLPALREQARKYDANQPRVPAGNPDGDSGRVTRTGRMARPRSDRARLSSRAFCEAQWNRDIFHCRMVGLQSCYGQAMVRLVACEKGQTIPPLTY